MPLRMVQKKLYESMWTISRENTYINEQNSGAAVTLNKAMFPGGK